MPEKLKLDEDGHVVTKEVGGVLMPVYTDGKKEETYDPPSMRAKIKTQAEDIADLEKTSTQESAESKKKLRAWERLGDIKEVRAAVHTVKTFATDDIDAAALPAKLAEIEAERDALKDQLTDATGKINDLESENYGLGVGNIIANAVGNMDLIEGITPSQIERLIDAKSRITKDQKTGKWVAHNEEGKPIMTVEGDSARLATIDEALDQLIPKTFRKPPSAAGSDAVTPQTTSTHGTVRSKTDLKGPTAKAEFIDKHGLEEFQKLPSGTPS
jgi:hypothetical protein